MKKYKYILFDLDRTLWDFNINSKNALSYTIDKFTPEIDKIRFINLYEEYNSRLWHQYEKGVIKKEELRINRFHIPLKEFGYKSVNFASDFAYSYIERMPIENQLLPNTLDILEYLKNLDCKMAIITNGFREVQYLKLKNSGIDKYFEAVLISEEVGAHKPSPIIFKKAIEAINGTKAESLMIGDSLITDIEGAQIYGIDQVYLNPEKLLCEAGPTYEIGDLKELKNIIK